MIDDKIFEGYENMELVNYDKLEERGLKLVKYSDLGNFVNDGVLKSSFYNTHGELVQLYTTQGNHVGVIAATRLGKTTSYVVPTIVSFAKQKVKKSFIVSDPKGEIYRLTAQTLKDEGYDVKLVNFRDYKHSEYWNPMTDIYRKYLRAMTVENQVELVIADGNLRNKFMGKIYENQAELDMDIEDVKNDILDSVDDDIDNFANIVMATAEGVKDPSWDDGARNIFRAFMHAMLEDSQSQTNPLKEEDYSIDTMLKILATFGDNNGDDYDDGYFSDRPITAKSYMYAKDEILISAKVTRAGFVSVFYSKISAYSELITRKVMSGNTIELEKLSDGPQAVFLCYRDELKAHFKTITLFVQYAYKALIERATLNENGKLDVPFYFILDEFGNFPAIKDFETNISACAGRNIWFILIMQSYAQLNSIYGDYTAEIIRDNLNVHLFFGSNNPKTLEEFSRECGLFTRVSPLSALNGSGNEMDNFQIETIPLVTKSRLSHLAVGEAIITEANSGYVILSKLERYYDCSEFNSLPLSVTRDYVISVKPAKSKYTYVKVEKQLTSKRRFDWDL